MATLRGGVEDLAMKEQYEKKNDECLMTNAERMSNAECRNNLPLPVRRERAGVRVFVIRASSFLRHWSLLIRHFEAPAVAAVAFALWAASAQLLGRFRMISMSLKMLLSRAPCCFTQSAIAVM